METSVVLLIILGAISGELLPFLHREINISNNTFTHNSCQVMIIQVIHKHYSTNVYFLFPQIIFISFAALDSATVILNALAIIFLYNLIMFFLAGEQSSHVFVM